jgi:hypothetical protein
MATSELPIGLDRARHLERGHHSAVPRRVGLAFLTLICLLGLANLFGQLSTVSRVDAAAASLTVDAPLHMRGGVIFTSQVTISAHRKLDDLQVQFSDGWFRGMTYNGIAPQANNENSSADGVTFDYGALDAGQSFPIWISWQVNPTNIGIRSERVTVKDGSTELVSLQRDRWVFP